MLGTVSLVLGAEEFLEYLASDECNPNDTQSLIRHLTAFLAAGLRSTTPDDLEDSLGVG